MYKNKILYIIIISFGLNQTLNNSKQDSNSTIENAIEKYSELAKENPDKKEIDYNLGNLNYYKGELEQAIYHYNEALKSENKILKSNTHFNLGNTYYNLNDYKKSI